MNTKKGECECPLAPSPQAVQTDSIWPICVTWVQISTNICLRDHCMLDFVSGPVRLLEMAYGRLRDVIHLVSSTKRCLPKIFNNVQVSPILKQTYLNKQRLKQPHQHIPVAQLISFWEEKGARWHCFLLSRKPNFCQNSCFHTSLLLFFPFVKNLLPSIPNSVYRCFSLAPLVMNTGPLLKSPVN